MRLLQISSNGDLSLVEYFGIDIPPYAILSHTWGPDDEEISFKDVKKDRAKSKPAGYRKVRFCGEQALRDGIHFFWVDTCCIKQESSQEVGEAINSMYRWYHDAVTCYVYLTDVNVGGTTHQDTDSDPAWLLGFRSSRWFTRGWTLQELIAPVSIEFYSQDGYRLGDRITLIRQIQWITGIAEAALRGSPLSSFTVEERITWARKRNTKREEDGAYSLLGLFGIHMPLIYGEGRKSALTRLQKEIVGASKEEPLSPVLNLSTVVASSATTLHQSSTPESVVSGPIAYTRTGGATAGKSFSRALTSHVTPDLHFVFKINEIRNVPDQEVSTNQRSLLVSAGISGEWWICGSSMHRMKYTPARFTIFDAISVRYSSGKYSIVQGDVTSLDREQWHDLSFLHNDEDFSSSLHARGTHPTLRCQRSGSNWPWFLFPNNYHGPLDPSQQYGGLRGSLSIFLALLALAIKPEELKEMLPRSRRHGQWEVPPCQTERIEGRGVVVYIYSGVEFGGTPGNLKAYEKGEYGNYFD